MEIKSLDLERTVWSYKHVEDADWANENIEIILNFYDKTKFEWNINKFSSKFNIDLDTFWDSTQNKNTELSDDVFQSNYHHSLILGSFSKAKRSNLITLTIEKVFTNEEKKYSEDKKEILVNIGENNSFVIDKDSIIGQISGVEDELVLRQIKQSPMKGK